MNMFDVMKEVHKLNKGLDDAINNPDLPFEESYKKIKAWIDFMQKKVVLK